MARRGCDRKGPPPVPHLTGSPVHSLLLKFLPNLEVNLRGSNSGGGFDVERVILLFDLYCWLGCCSHSDLPQHHIHPCRERGLAPSHPAERQLEPNWWWWWGGGVRVGGWGVGDGGGDGDKGGSGETDYRLREKRQRWGGAEHTTWAMASSGQDSPSPSHPLLASLEEASPMGRLASIQFTSLWPFTTGLETC